MEQETQQISLSDFKIYDINEEVVINNYPYGFNARCTLKVMIEQTERGQRAKTTTIFKGKENKPKYSTYDKGRFFLTKDNRLYSGWIEKDEDKTEVKIYNYTGGDYKPIAIFNFEDVKNLIPQNIIKPFLHSEKINDIIGDIWNKAQEEHDNLYKNKTEEEIKDFILNPINWVKGGGGYHSKEGFFKRDGGYSYFDGKKYKPSINVSFSCGFIEHSFDVDNEQNLKLTKSNKVYFEEQARKQLIQFLKVFPRERIIIDMRKNETTFLINDSYKVVAF